MSEPRAFAYHRGVAPMMWVLFALSLIELATVHLLVALNWPLIGWILTALSALGALFILLWILSFRRLPHRLEDSTLTLHFGNLKTLSLDLGTIAAVRRGWAADAVSARDAINLAGIAYPNRCIVLAAPVKRGKTRVFIRLDDPQAFDEAIGNAGVTLG